MIVALAAFFFLPAKDATELTKVELEPILGETSWWATNGTHGRHNQLHPWHSHAARARAGCRLKPV